MYEVKVLSAFIQSRKEFETANPYLKHNDLSPIGKAVHKGIGDYYKMDTEADYVDTEILTSMLGRQFSSVPKHKQELNDYLTELYAIDTSAVNVGNELLNAARDEAGMALADAILRRDDTTLADKLARYNEIMDAETLFLSEGDEYTGIDLDSLEEEYSADALIRVSPKALNDRLDGGMLRGQHMILAARPEIGKSLFGINMTSGFIQQKLRTLYVGNEDPMKELVLRLLSNLSGVQKKDIFNDKGLVMERARKRYYDLVTFQGMAPGSIAEIDAALRKDKYDVVVIDQLRNLTSKSENNTIRLEQVAQGARNLARRYNVLAVSITQAGDSARDKLVLNDGDIDGSNTGIPGACDVIVMVGCNDEYYLKDLRKLTLVKNKRGGKHDNFTVAIDRWRSRVKDFGGIS